MQTKYSRKPDSRDTVENSLKRVSYFKPLKLLRKSSQNFKYQKKKPKDIMRI